MSGSEIPLLGLQKLFHKLVIYTYLQLYSDISE